MSVQETLIVVVGMICSVVIVVALFVTSFWAIFDCAQSKDHSKQVKIRWLVALISFFTLFVPAFFYGRFVTKSNRLRAFTKIAFIALVLSSVTIFGAMMTAKDFLSPITSTKTTATKTNVITAEKR